MNRYYWIAITLTLLFVVSIGIIWSLDLTNQELQTRIEFTLQIFTAIDVIGAIIFGILGLINQSKKNDIKVEMSVSMPKVVSNLLGKDDSISHYLSNLEASLDSVSKFIPLSAEYEQNSEDNIIHLLQSFEWAKRENRFSLETITKKPIDFISAHEHFQRYVLLGDPGSGKTTCMQYLVQKLIADYKEDASRPIPFYVRLSEWKNTRTSALEFLRVSFERLAGSTSYLGQEFESLLSRGDLILILDGLNEMPGRRYHHEEKGQEIIDSIKILSEVSTGEAFRTKQDPRERSLRELASSDAVRTRFILSCRTHEFFESPKWQEIYVLPMSLEQISSFLTIYMDEKGNEFQSVLNTNSALMDLAKNPFFLRSMIRVYSPEITLIENKGRFLEYLCDQLFKRELNKGLIFEQRKLMSFISKFAFSMIKKGLVGVPVEIKNEIKKNQQLVNILIGTGLMIPRGENHVSFYHQIIQEFFAAYALREKNVKHGLSRLLAHKKWSEVLILWHDIDPASNLFSKLIDSLKSRNRPWTKPYSKPFGLILYDDVLMLFFIYFLTNVILDVFLSDSFATHLLTSNPLMFFLLLTIPVTVHYVWLFSSYHQEAISNVAFVLGRIKNPIAIEYLIDSFKHANASIRHTEISKSISQFGDVALPNLLSGLQSTNTHIKLGCIQALGELKNPKAVDPLINILKTGKTTYGAPAIRALGQIGDAKAAEVISESLSLIENMLIPKYSEFFPALIQMMEVEDVFLGKFFDDLKDSMNKNRSFFHRHLLVQYIGKFRHPDCKSILLEIIYDESDDVQIRQQAVTSLAYIRDTDIPSMLVEIYDRFDNLKNSALEALESINNPNAIQALYMLLDHEDWMIRRSAIGSIAKIGDLESLDRLTAMYIDESEEVRSELSKGLGILGYDKTIPTLMALVLDSSSNVRQEALASLDLAFPSLAHKKFLELAIETSYSERIKVIELLGNYRSSDVRDALISLCADVNNEVKTQAVNSLQRIDQNLSTELRYVRTGRKRRSIFNPMAGIIDKYKTMYSELAWLARNKGIAESQRLTWIMQQAQTDAELKREYRSFFILVNFFLITLCVIMPPALLAIAPRISIYLSNNIWNDKLFYGGMVVLALLSLLPKIREGARISAIKHIYSFIRFAGFSVLIISLLGLGFYYWWICFPVIILAGVGFYYWRNNRLRKKN